MIKNLKYTAILGTLFVFLYGCGMGADARQFPPEADKRIKKNIEEGRGFRIFDGDKKGGSGNFDFASSNSLWRASLDTIDFMPLASANYSGGIVVTDWYTEDSALNESIKISIRFMSNEIRADALDIKVFLKKCDMEMNCIVSENEGNLPQELRASILRRAAKYEKEGIERNKKENPYVMSTPGDKDKN